MKSKCGNKNGKNRCFEKFYFEKIFVVADGCTCFCDCSWRQSSYLGPFGWTDCPGEVLLVIIRHRYCAGPFPLWEYIQKLFSIRFLFAFKLYKL